MTSPHFAPTADTDQRGMEVLKMMWEVIGKEIPTPAAPKFKFENTLEAAQSNGDLLKKFKFGLHSALRSERKSLMGYGS